MYLPQVRFVLLTERRTGNYRGSYTEEGEEEEDSWTSLFYRTDFQDDEQLDDATSV